MFRKKRTPEMPNVAVPVELPPLEGLDDRTVDGTHRPPRAWLWTLIAALIVVLLVIYVIVVGAKAIYDGLKDRALENQQIAQEHYSLGLEQLAAKNYEMAIAEFELALRHDSSLDDAKTRLREAKELVRAQITPTSETRQDAVRLLYEEAVSNYGSGNLEQSVEELGELRGLDADYQRENVEKMLITAHYQLGLVAVAEDRLDEAIGHFEAVLAIQPDDKAAQDQLNLANLYTAALSNWERDWSATIQSLKGLYALAPEYKDVRVRLQDAYLFQAEDYGSKGDWCGAAEQYDQAARILPLEATVDKRDDARIRCQATAEAPPPTATSRPKPTPKATAPPASGTVAALQTTPQTTSRPITIGTGQIAFASFDAIRQRHDIYVVDLAEGDARLLQANASQPAFGPGGRRLAFRNLDPLHLGITILDLASNTTSEVTAHVEDSTPTWSSDTTQIVFASNKEGDRKWRLYAISPNEVRGEGEEWAFGQTPAWSRDGSRIAYHGCDERGDNCAIWVMQPGGFNRARLTSDPTDTEPTWSPDGTQIAFVSARAGNWELYWIDIATGQEQRLTNDSAADVAPVWSPDGKQIAFLSNRDGAWAVYVLDLKSDRVQRVIATGDAYPDPLSECLSWIP
jgi:tetratricopeptide (TPR) repeat protein